MKLNTNNSTNYLTSISYVQHSKCYTSFKANQQDSFENSSGDKTLKISKTNVALGSILALGLLFGADFAFNHGNISKSIWKKIHPTKKATKSSTENVEQSKGLFQGLGIETILGSSSEKCLQDLKTIKSNLATLEQNGVTLKPKTIVVSDWNNLSELQQICRDLKLSESEATRLNEGISYWGTVSKSQNGQSHVLINSAFGSDYGRFIHELGHISQDHIEASYWHSKGLSGKDFMNKQMEVLDISDVTISDFEHKYFVDNNRTPNIFRFIDCEKGAMKELADKNLPNCEGEKVFVLMNNQNRPILINMKKVVNRMGAESHVYAPNDYGENVAEIFQGLNEGKEYSDFVMLAYDIAGGGRVPNRIIKGKKYDDYIASLYENQELINELRNSIEIKHT